MVKATGKIHQMIEVTARTTGHKPLRVLDKMRSLMGLLLHGVPHGERGFGHPDGALVQCNERRQLKVVGTSV